MRPRPAPPSGGTAPSSGGTAPSSGGTAPSSGGTAPSSGGTAPSSGGTAPPSGGTAPSSGGTAPPPGETGPQSIVPGMEEAAEAEEPPAGRRRPPPAVLAEAWALARKHPLEAVSVILLGVGGLILPFPFWLIGGLVALRSRRWDARDKWIALAGPPLVTFAVLLIRAGTSRAISSRPFTTPRSTTSGSASGQVACCARGISSGGCGAARGRGRFLPGSVPANVRRAGPIT